MPIVIKEAGPAATAAAVESPSTDSLEVSLEMVPRNCTLAPPYKKVTVPPLDVTGEIIAFASPDSTFAVTKKLLDAAKKTIAIGIYDFTAGYMATILKDAMARRVKVTLMLDTDHVKGEDAIFQDLKQAGATCVSAPSCASENKSAKVFRSAHEKFIVIDDEICLVQSGNYSLNSIPMNIVDGKADGHFRTGNRDMGVAVRSKALAKFLTRLLQNDINLELNTPRIAADATDEETPPPLLVEAAPKNLPEKLFPSKKFPLSKPLSVQPILTPDNYMKVIPGVLRTAKNSVLIEQQYIHSADVPIAELLQAIADAKKNKPKFDVRIVLGKIFSDKDLPKEKINLANMASKYGLKIDHNIRYIDTTRLVHCHNKLIIVDGETVFKHTGVASYFTQIFEVDWKTGQRKLPAKIGGGVASPESLKRGGFIEVAAADYQQI